MLKPLISLVVLALWLGAATIVAAGVAPAAFAVLPSRAIAGALVGRVLPLVFWAGIVAGVATGGLVRGERGASYGTARGIATVGVALACAVAQLVLAPRIARLREQVGPSLDALAASDPLRVAFGRLHGYSVLCMGAGMVAAAVAIVLTLLALRTRG